MTKLPSSAEMVAQGGPCAAPELVEDPDVMVVGTVRAPIEQVWRIFRPFGPEIMRWWPIYEWVELDPPGADEVGAVRHFKANGRIYRERLILRDDDTYTMQYALVSSDSPIPIPSAITTIQMFRKGPVETEVRWSSKTDVNPLFKPLVTYVQRAAYYGAIEALARYFNPATAILEVKVISAKIPKAGILPPSTYVVAEIEGSPPRRTRIKPFTRRPKWNQSLLFNAGVFSQKTRLSLWGETLGRDSLLGMATVDFAKLLNEGGSEEGGSGDGGRNEGRSAKRVTVLLEGAMAGEIVVSLRYRPQFQVLRGAMTLAKTLGSSFGETFPLLGQLGREIGTLDLIVANLRLAARDYLTRRLGLAVPSGRFGGNFAGAALLDLRRAVANVQMIIMGLAEQFVALAQQIRESIKEGPLPVYRYARYPRMQQICDVPLENLPRMVEGLPRQEILPPSKLAGLVQRGLEYAFSQFDLVERYTRAILCGTDPFEAFFAGWVERADPVVDHWKEDTEFCRQLIQGVNPVVIKVVRSMDEIPPSMQLLSAQGKSLEELIKEKRLFILDYVLLSKLKLYRNMVFYAPIVLVYREILSETESRLNLVGIQLTRDPGQNVVYTAKTSPPNRYLYAKIQVQCADNQYHQFITHLGLAHLATEPMVIAHHNAFHKYPDHVIGKLLKPHF